MIIFVIVNYVLNYNIYRCDRGPSLEITSFSKMGGGVLIGVRQDIPSYIVPSPSGVEHQFISFIYNELTYLISGVYIPPLSPSLVYEQYMNSVNSFVFNFPA